MLGYDISWASFNVIEVMSSTRFTHKVRFSNLIFRIMLIFVIIMWRFFYLL